MSIPPSQLQIFVRVVELGGITAAANDLNVPKSTVSRQVARLEDRLGARLLDRTTRTIRATEVGQGFFERAVRILADIEEAEAEVASQQLRPRGTLRLTGPLTFGRMYLGDMLASFLTRYPDVELVVDLSDRMVDLVEEGFDVAIRVGVLPDSSLIARRLGPLNMVLAASPAYLEAHGTPTTVDDLRQHQALRYAYTPPHWSFAGDAPVPVRGRLECNNGEILRAAAIGGHGLVYSPRFIVDEALADGRLVTVLDDHVSGKGGVYALYPHHRHLSAKVRALVDHAVECFVDAPWA